MIVTPRASPVLCRPLLLGGLSCTVCHEVNHIRSHTSSHSPNHGSSRLSNCGISVALPHCRAWCVSNSKGVPSWMRAVVIDCPRLHPLVQILVSLATSMFGMQVAILQSRGQAHEIDAAHVIPFIAHTAMRIYPTLPFSSFFPRPKRNPRPPENSCTRCHQTLRALERKREMKR